MRRLVAKGHFALIPSRFPPLLSSSSLILRSLAVIGIIAEIRPRHMELICGGSWINQQTVVECLSRLVIEY